MKLRGWYKSEKHNLIFRYDEKTNITYRYYFEYKAWEPVCEGNYMHFRAPKAIHGFKELTDAEVFALML